MARVRGYNDEVAAGAIRRDIVVVGASAGGIDALQRLVAELPRDLPAAVFVVLHISPSGSALPAILGRASELPVSSAVDGDTVQEGHIYVAPPDRHLALEPNRIRVLAGPRQNGHRPAVDPLFRTAAWAYGPRVAGVVLSGVLDDGTLGARSIKQHGGVTVAQDPDEAAYSSMPQSVIDHDSPDAVVGVVEIARLLVDMATVENGHHAPRPVEVRPLLEVIEGDRDRTTDGEISPFTCPECSGTLWEVREGSLTRFRCRVGHSYTQGAMDVAQSTSVEAALWTALRAVEERIALKRRLAQRMRDTAPRAADRFADEAALAEEHRAVIRQILESVQAPAASDEPIVGGAS